MNEFKQRGAISQPLQILSEAEKTEDWYKDNIEFRISRAGFMGSSSMAEAGKDLRLLYEVYNNKFPLKWFDHITNPLSAKVEAHKSFPAKIRPVTILRTNIDLLLGEYPRRPFVYNVENLGESGYNQYTQRLQKQIEDNLTQWFINATLNEMKASGQQLTPEQMQQLQQNPPVPEDIKKEFGTTYKDAIAIKGQKWLRRAIREKNVKKKLHKMFKDWLIAGQCYSYKGVSNEELEYERISPLNLRFDKSSDSDFIEDGEWVVCRRMNTVADIVDRFYSKLTEKNHKFLDNQNWYGTPMAMYDGLSSFYGEDGNKVPLYHVQWKGRRKIGFVSYLDPETYQIETKEVDEAYMVDRSNGEVVEWKWINVVYEGWRVGDGMGNNGEAMYFDMQEVAVQRNEMNNVSRCKLSYNGRKYSDLHADNISVLEIGIPFQNMYIITNYTLEKTIAKSKGKILLIDQNAIPNEGDWDDEKFFYYSEAMGYGLLNRNQPGVDKTWNQYQVVDMSLFDQIKQLIDLLEYFKQQWDDIIGINRQRKGQTYSSDGQGVNERAAFQSTVITDMIFINFEEFQERELQGILDYAKFLTAKGKKGLYNDDMYGTTLMEIDPEDFPNEDLGVFVDGASEHMRKLEEMKQYAQSMLQNNAKPSTVLEVIDSINVAELKQKLRQIERIEQEQAQANATSEQDHQKELEEIKQRYMAYESMLERENNEADWDRKDQHDEMIENIRGTYNTFTFQNGDADANGEPDAQQAQKILLDLQKHKDDVTQRNEDRKLAREEVTDRRKKMEHDIQQDKIKNTQVNRKLAIDNKKANQKPKTSK